MPVAEISEGSVHLRAGGVSLVLAPIDDVLPEILYWGEDLGDLDQSELAELARATVAAPRAGELDRAVRSGLAREHAAGCNGRPGLTGHRDGSAWSPWFTVTDLAATGEVGSGGRVMVAGADTQAGLNIDFDIELLPSGLLRQRVAVTNIGQRFTLDGLSVTWPVPPVATELFDLAGRWGRERAPQRTPFTVGLHARENRRGRTGPDAPLVLAAGTGGFGFGTGEIWAVHVGWSGNHLAYGERLASGQAVLGGGELLLPGEVQLERGQQYTSPWVYASYGVGFDAVAARFHQHLRASRTPAGPRERQPVVLNTWEAVYFDHDGSKLGELAERGARVGAERFVLDDGWFRNRDHDAAGLGDWYVDERTWPDGLHPLIERVHELGMDFGLWVEPEMVNRDSDLVRQHPDWILATGGRFPLPFRNQQVLDLTRPQAYEYVLGRLDALLTEYDIAYLKWDHNRDLLDAGSGPLGTPGVHAQTRAAYRLLDEVRQRHPRVCIESCSSGGARVDLGVLERADRVWASDVLDPLERQHIQRWTNQLLPPELVGCHVGASRSHTTGRQHDLSFRAGTALFGSFGIEGDLTVASAAELDELTRWVDLYKELRGLLHTGTVVRADPHDPALALHGVVAADRGDALFALVQLDAPSTSEPPVVRLPRLHPEGRYRVRPQPPGHAPAMRQSEPVPWTERDLIIGGKALARCGIRAPAMYPEQLMLVRASRVG